MGWVIYTRSPVWGKSQFKTHPPSIHIYEWWMAWSKWQQCLPLHTVLGLLFLLFQICVYFCFSRFLVWLAGWYSHHVRKLAERLTNSNSDLVFQVSMGPKFFQYMGEIILFTCFEFSTQLARHCVFLFFHWIPQLFAVPLLFFLTLFLQPEKQYALTIEWWTLLLE